MFRTRIAQDILLIFLFCVSLSFDVLSQTQTSSGSFRISYTSNLRYFAARKYIHTRNNETIIAGKHGLTEDGSDLLMMRLDKAGGVVWAKKVAVGILLLEYELAEMNDGTIMLVTNSWYNDAPVNSDMLLMKFSCDGDLLWSRNLTLNTPAVRKNLIPYSIKAGKDNDAIVSFYGNETNATYSTVCRINSSGNLAWSKSFYGNNSGMSYPAISFLADNKIVVFGANRLYTNSYNFYKSFFAMRLNYDDGSLEETKGFDYSEFMTYASVLIADPKIHFYVQQLDNGSFALYGEFSNFDKQKAYFYKLIINKDFSVKQAKAFSIPAAMGTNWTKMSVFPNGRTELIAYVYERNMVYWYVADSVDNRIWERKIPYLNVTLQLQYMGEQNGANQSSYIISTITQTSSSIEMVQAEDNDKGILPCLGTDTAFVEKLSWDASIGTAQWSIIKDNEAVLTSRQFTATDVSVKSTYACEPVKNPGAVVDQVKIRGTDTVCVPNSSYNYVASTINKTGKIQWSLGTGTGAGLTPLNDSMVAVTFTNPVGMPDHVKLYASTSGCNLLKDSISIAVFPKNNKLAIDFNSCDLPLKITPGSWFKSYIWQDGTTDSIYIATKPGKYAVRLTSYCGDSFIDSIEISGAKTGIKSRYVICKGDSVTLSAVAGFSSYEWTPSYNILNLSPGNVLVYPAKDTFYILTSLTAPGCRLIDTIFVKVNHPTPVNIGSDIVMCARDMLTLDAGNNFSTYHWNTGDLSQKTVVDSPGTYFVTVTDKNACRSADTINVQTKECQNSIYFPNAFTPDADGKNDLFKPVISGRIIQYELAIFNRFGEIIFRTNQPRNGWNGTLKGIAQKNDTFVWVCKYTFENEKPVIRKGVLFLIR